MIFGKRARGLPQFGITSKMSGITEIIQGITEPEEFNWNKLWNLKLLEIHLLQIIYF